MSVAARPGRAAGDPRAHPEGAHGHLLDERAVPDRLDVLPPPGAADHIVTSPKQAPVITLTTDFGTDDIFVGVMKGVILGINPAACIVDLTHSVPPQAVDIGALLLRLALPYFPAGTIHLAVVDPGVGSPRRAVCAKTASGVLVGPDNGLLTPAAERAGVQQVVECTDPTYWLPVAGPTFHGRDIFAPVAAHLSLGVPLERLGNQGVRLTPLVLPEPQREAGRESPRVLGLVIHVDRFGNLITNVAAADLEGFPRQQLSVSIAGVALRGLVSSYAAVPEGELLALLNSWGLLEIAQRNGSARDRAGVGRGAPVVVTAWPTADRSSPTTST
jgi:S-adenosylmethionine hydrolase